MRNFPRGLYNIQCEILHGFSPQIGPSFKIHTPWRLNGIPRRLLDRYSARMPSVLGRPFVERRRKLCRGFLL